MCFTVTVTLSITEGYINCNHSPYTQDVWIKMRVARANKTCQENALKVSVEDLFLTFVFLSSRIVLCGEQYGPIYASGVYINA